MKRLLPLALAVAGTAVILLVLPLYQPAQPKWMSITRGEARRIAGEAARKVGVKPDQSWSTVIWSPSPILQKALRNHPRRAEAWDDDVLGPRLRAYRVTYYHVDKDKYPPAGYVFVGGRYGNVTGSRRISRPEEPGRNPTEAELRPLADAFVKSREFRGAPSPVFESARPTVLRGRTDWVFRYRVTMKFPLEDIVPYLYVYYVGGQPAGWMLFEEYADGRPFAGDDANELAGMLIQFVTMGVLLLILLVIFLRKYHAGEVGVGAASAVFIVMIVLLVSGSLMVRTSMSDGTGFGSISAPTTSWAVISFKILFADLPLALVVFLGWAVGESYARERWGDKLAAFEAIFRRDPFNATVGRSLLSGTLLAPVVAAAALGIGAIAVGTRLGWASHTGGTRNILYAGGPLIALVGSACTALVVSVVCLLFLLAWTHRRRVLGAGIAAAAIVATLMSTAPPAVDPIQIRMLFGFGGVAAAIAIFLRSDLLTATTALFGGSLITFIAPLLSVSRGDLARDLALVLAVPLVLLAGFGLVAMLTQREVVYSHEDLAPHVRRIVERERVKAEIDAANRIQAALLPLVAPKLAGATFSSHYRAATEIGGDYFDFLEQPGGEIGIAFGDVSGHGLTSGIVMSMAKAALLVQVEYDSSPRAVLSVLNDIVMKTAPRRILMTFFFGLLDPRSQTLRFSSAGHLDPYVYRAATRKLEALSSWGFPLGVRRREDFREHTVSFAPGDRLVLYSDGLIEAIDDDGEPFGFERFEHVISGNGHLSADDLKKTLLNAVKKFTRNRPPEDDQTLVVVAFEDIEARVLVSAASSAELVSEAVN